MTLRIGRTLLLCLGAALAGACVSIPIVPFEMRSELQEETLEPAKSGWTSAKVALVSISGTISGDAAKGLLGKDSTVVWVKDQLKKAEKDRNVKAIVLRIDSPGGDVTASDIIYHEILRLRQERKIPVVVSMMDLAASGGYYVAMAGDKLLAHPTTITGSIGVIATLPKLQPLSQKIGVEMRTIKSGEVKDIGSLWRDFAPGEREILQNMVNSMYERFLEVVAKGRPNLKPGEIRRLADGRVYTAQEALNLGLIDGIGYLDGAVKAAREEAHLKDASLVTYRKQFDYKGHMYANADGVEPQALVNMDLGDVMERFTRPSVQYLWAP